MEPNYLIVLYSKYSPRCQQLLEIFNQNPVSHIKLVCVDNNTVRKRLTQSSRVRVNTVPCVLLAYPNDKFEKFEGAQVYDWLIRQIGYNPPESSSQSQQPSVLEQPFESPPVQHQTQPENIGAPLTYSPQTAEDALLSRPPPSSSAPSLIDTPQIALRPKDTISAAASMQQERDAMEQLIKQQVHQQMA